MTAAYGQVSTGYWPGVVIGTVGKRSLEKAFLNAVKAIEARNGGARPAESS